MEIHGKAARECFVHIRSEEETKRKETPWFATSPLNECRLGNVLMKGIQIEQTSSISPMMIVALRVSGINNKISRTVLSSKQ